MKELPVICQFFDFWKMLFGSELSAGLPNFGLHQIYTWSDLQWDFDQVQFLDLGPMSFGS
jgi:hypothetical protein